MKKLVLTSLLLLFLTSCGPHRMSCGARGICNNNPKVIEKNS